MRSWCRSTPGQKGPRSTHRPLGGHVEFGEYAAATVHREFAEEIAQPLTDVRLLGVLENIFEWQGAAQQPDGAVSPPRYPDGVLDLVRRGRWW